jgi:hypothetical protein
MGIRTPGTGERLRAALGEGLRENEPLRHHTTFRVGGPADWFFAARTSAQLVTALRTAHELDLPSFLLGGGSNLLVSDEGFRGIVVRNAIEDIAFDGTTAQVGCGADYLTFIQRCQAEALAGLAYAAGIPGSGGRRDLRERRAATGRTSARASWSAPCARSRASVSRRFRETGISSPIATRGSSASRARS